MSCGAVLGHAGCLAAPVAFPCLLCPNEKCPQTGPVSPGVKSQGLKHLSAQQSQPHSQCPGPNLPAPTSDTWGSEGGPA